MNSRIFTQLKGLIGLIVIGVVVVSLYGTYQQWFTSATRVTVEADRAGLLLDDGAAVRLYGVRVGSVRGISASPDGAVIDVALDKDQAHLVPESATAKISATTLFGAKVVELVVPDGQQSEVDPIRAGQTILATSTTTEVNDVFEHAITLLDAVDVEKLNTTLSSTAAAFEGRGQQFGELISNADSLLQQLNPSLDQLGEDFRLTDEFLGNVNQVAPQALDVVSQVTTTSDLFVDTQDAFHSVVDVLIPTADDVTALVGSFDAPLTAATRNLAGTVGLANEYAPQLTCMLDQLSEHNTRFAAVFDQQYPALMGHTAFLPGQDPYTFEKNAPKLVTGVGPRCYRQPTPERPFVPHIQLDDGTFDIYEPEYGGAELNTPVTIYEDAVRSFLGESALGLLSGLAPNEAVTP